MKVEDIERAVVLKRGLDEIGNNIEKLKSLLDTGVSSIDIYAAYGPGRLVSLPEVSYGQDFMLGIVRTFLEVQEGRYAEILNEIAAL